MILFKFKKEEEEEVAQTNQLFNTTSFCNIYYILNEILHKIFQLINPSYFFFFFFFIGVCC